MILDKNLKICLKMYYFEKIIVKFLGRWGRLPPHPLKPPVAGGSTL